MYLSSFNIFRAIAIILIVAGHCYDISGIHLSTINFYERITVNLITGGTTLFVFISGFLFHHIFMPKYQYKKFIVGKVKNVLIPYLILSLPYVVFHLKSKGLSLYNEPELNDIFVQDIIPILKYYLIGNEHIAFWYIPFILITFSMAPLHVKFIQQSTKIQLVFIATFLVISALLHRSLDNANILQSVLYFLPVYLIGIFCSINKEKIYSLFINKEVYLLLIVIFLATYEVLSGMVGNYEKEPLSLNGIDIMLFQKITLSLFLMVWLHRFEKTSIKLLDIIAATSFSIFFLHGYLIGQVVKVFKYVGLHDLTSVTKTLYLSPWLYLTFFVVTFVLISSLIAISLKKIIPKYSRYLVGY